MITKKANANVYRNYKKNIWLRYLGSHQLRICPAHRKECHVCREMIFFSSARGQKARVNTIRESEKYECVEPENHDEDF